MINFNEINWDEQGRVPAIIQDERTQQVLMVAWMNAESLHQTLALGETVFWSRSRNELWHKGATSGNIQRVRHPGGLRRGHFAHPGGTCRSRLSHRRNLLFFPRTE